MNFPTYVPHTWSFPICVEDPRDRLVGGDVVDGDTFDAEFDLGLRTSKRKQRIRLLGINTPERSAGTTYLAAKRFTEAWIVKHQSHSVGLEWPLVAYTVKDLNEDAFRRILAWVFCVSCHACLARELFESGNAIEFVKR